MSRRSKAVAAASLPALRDCADGEHETEEMVWVGAEDGVGLCSREVGESGDLRDAAHVVARVEVERLEHLVGRDRHLREELNAVGAAALVERHDAVEEAVGALARRQPRDVGGAAHGLGGWHFAELCLRERVERCVEACGGRCAEPLGGDEGNQRDERDRRDDPREGGRPARDGGGRDRARGGAAVMAESRAGRERRRAGPARGAVERRAAAGAEAPLGGRAAGWAGGGGHGGNVVRR